MKVIYTRTGPDLARALAGALWRRSRTALDGGGLAATQDKRPAANGPAASAAQTTEDGDGKPGQ